MFTEEVFISFISKDVKISLHSIVTRDKNEDTSMKKKNEVLAAQIEALARVAFEQPGGPWRIMPRISDTLF